ncbi:hypothetical protein [Spiroplasma turonicum]|uniref:Uncharacterized protein n=1 Tax=Spiroplasma turonicum TaxID=216946 RepID=A0A0K1P600_9MOLU|nr:hypothetical protein [Spiroplasma turonicum]AKU79347.1 hypothetical protein STURON_00101 [Spiroplasma turonicum]ALX70368.1 hypothetical protein STURO_v1c00990 [Spiroplasma turonicum]
MSSNNGLENKEIKIPKKNKNRTKSKIRTLFLINLKRVYFNKGIIAMACVFLILSFIFALSLPTTVDSSFFIGFTIQFFLLVFFYIVFITLLINDLFKRQMIDGVQIIEIRSGIKIHNSYMMRYLLYLTVSFVISTLNLIINIIFKSGVMFSNNEVSKLIWSTILFFFLFTIIWAPIIISINVSVSVAGSIVLNLFLGTILIFSQFISVIAFQIAVNNNFNDVKLSSLTAWTAKTDISYSMYENFKNDGSISKWYEDEYFIDTINKNLENIYSKVENDEQNQNYKFSFNNWSELHNIQNNKFSSNSQNISAETALGESLIGFRTNYAIKIDNEGKPIHILDNTKLFILFDKMFNLLNDNFISNESRAPYNNADKKTFLSEENDITSYIDISNLIDWFINQNELREYKELLIWANKEYNKYATSFAAASSSNYYSSEIYYFLQTYSKNYLLSNWKKNIPYDTNDTKLINYNNNVDKVYNRYPELILINWFIISNYINGIKADITTQENTTFKSYLNKLDNKAISSTSMVLYNPFSHFWNLYFNSFTEAIPNDLFNSSLNDVWQGPRSSIKNFSELEKYNSKSRIDDKLYPIYKEYKPNYTLTFSITGAYAFYILFSILITFISFLIFRKVSRI